MYAYFGKICFKVIKYGISTNLLLLLPLVHYLFFAACVDSFVVVNAWVLVMDPFPGLYGFA